MDSVRSPHTRVVVAITALVASITLAASASADPVFVSKFASAGTGAGQLNLPQQMAIDGSDRIYIADENNNRVSEFDTAGGFTVAFGWGVDTGIAAFEACTTASGCQAGIGGAPWGAGEVDAPVGIATDVAGNVYVGENSARISEFAGGVSPGFVKAFGWGVDTGAGAFETCTSVSTCQIGTSGAGAGEFQAPFGIVVDPVSGDIFTTDRSANRVNQFSSTPTFTKAWGWGVDTGAAAFETCTTASGCQGGSALGGAGELSVPVGIALDPSRNIYVAEESDHRITEFSPAGAFTKAFGWGVVDGLLQPETCTVTCVSGQGGNGAGQFFIPEGAVFDADGNLWVADMNNHRIQEFDAAGNFRLLFGWGVKDGSAAFQVCRAGCRDGLNGAGDGEFSNPTDVGFDSTGDLFVVDKGNNRIQHFDVGHNLDVAVAGTGTGSVTGVGIACPGTCSAAFATGTPETLVASPSGGSTFAGWSGACTGTGTCNVTMSSDKSVTATFDPPASGGGGGGGGTTPPASSPATSTATATPAGTTPPPVEFQTGNAEPVGTGTVLVKQPGATTFVPITTLTSIPVGSIVDARRGRVRITIDIGGGKTATADFYEGQFKFLQQRPPRGTKVPYAVMELVGGSFAGCPKAKRASAAAKRKAKSSVRHLWGSGSGPFRTKGRYASATIRGTTWDTDDRCNGTNVKVTTGSVTVRDLVKKKDIVVKAPKQYLAKAPAK